MLTREQRRMIAERVMANDYIKYCGHLEHKYGPEDRTEWHQIHYDIAEVAIMQIIEEVEAK